MVDCDEDPWNDSVFDPLAFSNAKVDLELSTHKYSMFDKRGFVIQSHIISASSLFNYFNIRRKSKNSLIQDEEKMSHFFSKSMNSEWERILKHVLRWYLKSSIIPKDRFERNEMIQDFQISELKEQPPKNISHFFTTSFYEWIDSLKTLDVSQQLPQHDELMLFFRALDIQSYEKMEDLTNHPNLTTALDSHYRNHLNEVIGGLSNEDGKFLMGLPIHSGTQLHSYIESRLLQKSSELAKLECPCREDSDYEQVDDFVELNDELNFVGMEVRLGSLLHRICGCVDGVEQCADGSMKVWDWKRTGAFFEKKWWDPSKHHLKPFLISEPKSSDLIKYAIQMAIYRKLIMMNSLGVVVQSVANLVIFHPLLTHWVKVELNLNEKVKCFRKMYEVDTPIELVELMFEFRFQELCDFYQVDSNKRFLQDVTESL